MPVVAPLGTVTTTEVSLHEVVVALVPLKETKLDPAYWPKPVPVTVTVAPICPEPGETPATTGVTTVNGDPLLAEPYAVTMTFPLVAPEGTCTVIALSLQEEILA